MQSVSIVIITRCLLRNIFHLSNDNDGILEAVIRNHNRASATAISAREAIKTYSTCLHSSSPENHHIFHENLKFERLYHHLSSSITVCNDIFGTDLQI